MFGNSGNALFLGDNKLAFTCVSAVGGDNGGAGAVGAGGGVNS